MPIPEGHQTSPGLVYSTEQVVQAPEVLLSVESLLSVEPGRRS